MADDTEEKAICGIGTKYIGPTHDGVEVQPVHQNTIAYEAGIKHGDVIVGARETGQDHFSPVRTMEDFLALRGLLGSTVDLEVRDFQTGEIKPMHLTRRPYMINNPDALITPTDLERESCGPAVTQQDAPQHGLPQFADNTQKNGTRTIS